MRPHYGVNQKYANAQMNGVVENVYVDGTIAFIQRGNAELDWNTFDISSCYFVANGLQFVGFEKAGSDTDSLPGPVRNPMPPCDETRLQTWFVIAAYNEASVIRSVVAEVRSIYPNVIVVNDGSTDNTGEEAVAAGAILVTHAVNLGQGAALQTGITFALRRQAAYIVTFDADGQHNVSDVDAMLDVLKSSNIDVVLGSRFHGTTENLPRLRWLMLRAAILFTRLSTGLQLTDTHNGLRAMRAEAAKRITLQQNGMAHASEFLEQIAELGLSYTEVPVSIRYTAYSLQKGQKLSNSLNIMMDLLIGRFTK